MDEDRAKKNKTRPIWSFYNNGDGNSTESLVDTNSTESIESAEDFDYPLANTTRLMDEDRAKKNKTKPIWSFYNNGDGNSAESFGTVDNSTESIESVEDYDYPLTNTTRFMDEDRTKKNKTRPVWSFYNNGDGNSTESFDTVGDVNSTESIESVEGYDSLLANVTRWLF